MPLSAGTRLGPYEVLAPIGAGGMGEVYRAHDPRMGRDVAIKVSAERFSDRFSREVRAVAALNHSHICQLYDVGPDYMVMELCEGETLAARLQRGKLSVQETIRFGAQIADALSAAHAKGIVHRDLKPGNVMLTKAGVKVLDFGLAKIEHRVPDEELTDTMTAAGTLLGTLRYMSPERARGESSDERADVWSLGVVLYEMLTGQAPFRGDNQYLVLHAILTKTPDLDRPDVMPLRPVLERAMEKDVNLRFRSMDEFREALETTQKAVNSAAATETMPAMQPLPLKSGKPSSESRESGVAPKPARRWPVWTAVAVAAIAAAVLLMRFWPASERSVAVLPFAVMGSGGTEAALADGLQETLTSRLSELERFQEKLWVVPATEVRRSAAKSASDVRRAFGANLAVTGSVQRVGPALRLSLNLVDARTLRQLRSAVLDEPGGDWLSLQDRAVAELTSLLAVRGWDPAARSREAVSPDVYESYLKAVGLLQRWDKAKDLSECRQLLEDVVAKAPRFGSGHVVLANAYWTSYTQDNDPTWVGKARDQVSEAKKLEPNSAAVHEMMGRIRAGSEQRDLAVMEFQEALKFDPRSQIALSGMARAYEAMGRKDEAESTFRKSIALRPQAWIGYNNLGAFYYRQRRYADAEVQYRKGLGLTPDNPGLLNNLGNALKNQGRMKEAAAAFQRAVEIEPNYIVFHNFGTFYYQQGDFARSAQMFEKAVAINPKDFRVWGSLGSALLRSGGSVEKQREVFTKASELGEKLLAAMPSNAENRSLVAEYQARLGQGAKARRHLTACTPGSTEDAGVWLRVASVWVLLGDREEAERAVKMAVTYGATQGLASQEPELKGLEILLPKASRKKD